MCITACIMYMHRTVHQLSTLLNCLKFSVKISRGIKVGYHAPLLLLAIMLDLWVEIGLIPCKTIPNLMWIANRSVSQVTNLQIVNASSLLFFHSNIVRERRAHEDDGSKKGACAYKCNILFIFVRSIRFSGSGPIFPGPSRFYIGSQKFDPFLPALIWVFQSLFLFLFLFSLSPPTPSSCERPWRWWQETNLYVQMQTFYLFVCVCVCVPNSNVDNYVECCTLPCTMIMRGRIWSLHLDVWPYRDARPHLPRSFTYS